MNVRYKYIQSGKKWLSLLIVIGLLAGLSGCGGTTGNSPAANAGTETSAGNTPADSPSLPQRMTQISA